MREKGKYAPVIRRLITVFIFIGIAATFMAMYYLVFLPQQHSLFNLRTFRILDEISDNFNHRIENYSTYYINNYLSKNFKERPLSKNDIAPNTFTNNFKKSFRGDPSKIDRFETVRKIEDDSFVVEIKQKGEKPFNKKELLGSILEPLISIHADAFEGVLLIRQTSDSSKKGKAGFSSILYRSSSTNLSGSTPDSLVKSSRSHQIHIVKLNADSLLKNSLIEAPVIRDIEIENVSYKIFLLPFQIPSVSDETFVLTGLMSQQNYRQQSQNIPFDFLLSVCALLIFFLLALPFLKIFIVSVYENITVRDVRFLIAVIFVLPFIITLFAASAWLYLYPKQLSDDVLLSVENKISYNLNKEIGQVISQEKEFDKLIDSPTLSAFCDSAVRNNTTPGLDIKDYIFYPRYYRNIEGIHWLDSLGNDVASWNLIKPPATYFKLGDRQYFRDIFNHRGYTLPEGNDTFSIQPNLSRLTGEYTINIAIASKAKFTIGKKPAVMGISTKMYSLYNTVLPPGYGYCIIDGNGNILSHSEAVRNLQENLFDETSQNHALLNAVNHKDNVAISDIEMYEQPVKMRVKSLATMPLYLVTFYYKKRDYLFIVHMAAFVFVCETILLLMVSVFAYLMMWSGKEEVKLLFIPGIFEWMKPSPKKQKFYIGYSVQQLSCLFLVFLFSLFLTVSQTFLFLLNVSFLLPLFVVTSYYIMRKGRAFIEKTQAEENSYQQKTVFFSKSEYLGFLYSIRNILLLYVFFVVVFGILQNVLFFYHFLPKNTEVKLRIWLLIIVVPIIVCLLQAINFDNVRIKNPAPGIKWPKPSYLNYYIFSLLLSVALIGVLPTIAFTGYAFHEEKKLNYKTLQIDLAKKLQQRRTEVNNTLAKTKLGLLPAQERLYHDSLKYNTDKGLYLYNNQLLHNEKFDKRLAEDNNFSPFYKIVTQFLFLPPEHDEFYDDTSHHKFYYWKQKVNAEKSVLSLQFFYKNLTDYKDTSAISLKGDLPDFYVLENVMNNNKLGLLILITLLVSAYLFCRVIYSTSKRIFLINYFPGAPAQADADWLKQKYSDVDMNKLCAPWFENEQVDFGKIRRKEDELLRLGDGGEGILKLHLALNEVYEKFWNDCTETEKYTTYDFALDGFTNYKKTLVLHQLYNKGLFIKEDGYNIALVSKSYRNFLLTKDNSQEIKALSQESKGSWTTVRTVFYIVLVAVAVFIFISQEEASKRLITIVTSFGALLPVILKLFDKSTFAPGSK